MAEIVKAIDIAVPVEVAFDFVANPHNGLKFMPNFTKFQPVGSRDHGKLWEIEDGLGYDWWIGRGFDSGSLWDEHAYSDPAPDRR